MLENDYSDDQKLFLFLDWLGCNNFSLDKLWLDSDFISGFRKKLFSEAAAILKNLRGNNIGLHKDKSEINGVIDCFLADNFYGMKNRHNEDKYKFDDIKAVYAVIHQRIGFGKFRPFFNQIYFGMEVENQERQTLEEVDLYLNDSARLDNEKTTLEKMSAEGSDLLRASLSEILKEFEIYLKNKKRKNGFDLAHFLQEVSEAIKNVGLKIKYKVVSENGEDKEIIEMIEFETADANLAIFQFLDQSDGLNQDEIKCFIENCFTYQNSYEHSLKKIRLSWKQFDYDKSRLAKQAKDYQQILRKFTEAKISHFYKISDNQKNY